MFRQAKGADQSTAIDWFQRVECKCFLFSGTCPAGDENGRKTMCTDPKVQPNSTGNVVLC